MNKIKILCTLGPSSINSNFLKFCKNKVFLFRLNLSHLNHVQFERNIKYIKKYSNIPICVDTEGAQLRTTKSSECFLKRNKNIKVVFSNDKSNNSRVCLYPKYSIKMLKINTIIDVGFDDLQLKVKKINKDHAIAKVISEGILGSNKGVHFSNNIKLNSLTEKDLIAIEIAKKYNLKYFALSFANNAKDVVKLKKIIKYKSFVISKIETKLGYLNRTKIINKSDAILIDRGDLSRYISIEKIPIAQKLIIQSAKKLKKNVYVATNLLETMILKKSPTRAESNDIFSSLYDGANGLVLAAETAIGRYPQFCVTFLTKIIKNFNDFKRNKIKLF